MAEKDSQQAEKDSQQAEKDSQQAERDSDHKTFPILDTSHLFKWLVNIQLYTAKK